jgi:ribosomal-protein-alanine N-acetyltransferase
MYTLRVAMALSTTLRPLRVALRPALPADAGLLFRWRGEPSVRRHQPLSDASIADLRADLVRHRHDELYRGRGERFQWIVLVEGEAAGWITLAVASWEHGLAEIGYALSTPFQGRGVMRNALEQLAGELFGHTALERLEARCAIDNVASQRVLEAVGFEREGRLRSYFRLAGERVDNYLYSLLRDDLLGRRG